MKGNRSGWVSFMINFRNNFQSQSRNKKSQRFPQRWKPTRDLGQKPVAFPEAGEKGLVVWLRWRLGQSSRDLSGRELGEGGGTVWGKDAFQINFSAACWASPGFQSY